MRLHKRPRERVRRDHFPDMRDSLLSLDGGKDEILGLRMSIFVRHPLGFSIGRAMSVEPRSIMMSGWTTKHPDSLSQYNEQLRTITMET
jgi:hypothetical protein